jgi:peptide/nickel transport system substrate-binding protein
VRLDQAPLLLENQESGNYTIQLKPTVGMPAVSFNFTAEDEAKREVFQNLDFRIAMSVAINRDELNEVAYFGQGTPSQILPFNPVPEFVDPQWASFAAEYDPTRANELLDSIGMADTDGDGFRELPNGDRMTLALNYSTQGISGSVVELISQYWAEVGIQSVVKEVTPDEYRSAQSANQLDVLMWLKGQPAAIHMGDLSYWEPPFDGYFDIRTGMLWAEWNDSDGAAGVEPPAWTKELTATAIEFQSSAPGSEAQAAAGAKMAETMVDQMLFIGTVLAPAPIYHRNALENVPEFQTWSYEYYRTYPYRAHQWWLSDES